MAALRTDFQVKNAPPGVHNAGPNLLLHVQPIRADGRPGSRAWVCRVTVSGRRVERGLGSYPDISLADARIAAAQAAQAAKRGIDPRTAREAERGATTTFSDALDAYWAEAGRGRSGRNPDEWPNSIRRHAPKLLALPVSKVGGSDVRDAVSGIWLAKPETGRRVLQRVRAVHDYAVSKGWAAHELPMRAIMRGLPRQTAQVRHHPAVKWAEAPALFAALVARRTPAALTLAFQLATAARPGEARFASWLEVEFDRDGPATWHVPAERMKQRRPHRVPLNRAALGVLWMMLESRTWPGPLLVEGRKGALSEAAAGQALAAAGHPDKHPHGLRSTFREWAAETGEPDSLAEASLAHALPAVAAAYQRSDLLGPRRALMERWSSFLVSGLAGNQCQVAGTK